MLCSPLDKIFIIVNNIDVGREPLSFRRVKDSASHPTIEVILILLRVCQVLIVALSIYQHDY